LFKRQKNRPSSGGDWPTKYFSGIKLRRHKSERASQGYSVFDWWSFDTYITWVIGNAVLDFKNAAGYIHGDTDEENNEFLDSIAKPLLEYSEKKFDVFGDDALKLHEDASAALHKFADRLGWFWD